MKFMKLGAKVDIFHTEGNLTSVATDLSSDVVIKVDYAQLHLHKFPLLCKSGKLQKLIAEAREMSRNEIDLEDFPGGNESLELCMKFCYGIAITFNAYNVVPVRCGAEFLEMTEAIEKGNLIYKLEVFLNTSIFRSWKDSIIVLQSCKALMPWSEDLKIVARCIDSIASKTATDPAKVDWSFTHTRTPTATVTSVEHSTTDLTSPPWNGIQSRRHRVVPKDWWAEDILELEMDFYWRVMVAIKAKGMAQDLVGEALRLYALRWLPGLSKDDGGSRPSAAAAVPCEAIEVAGKHRLLLETIVNLLPAEKGTSCCSFLLKLLKAATILNASPSCKMELARRIGLQLEEATLDDLLIPSLSYTNDTLFDVDVIQHILEHFLMQDQSPAVSPTRARQPGESRRRTRSAENLDFSESRRATCATHSSKLKVAKLIDSYLAEIARDPNIQVSKFVSLAEAIPDFARPVHDGLYRGIDMYLKEHPNLSKSDRKRICRLMDCKKLSMDACMHAAQNERLPLRVVVQVLFFEQVRTAMTGGFLLHDLPGNIKALLPPSQVQALEAASLQDAGTPEEAWDTVHHDFNALKGDLANMKKRIAEAERERTNIQLEAVKQSSKQKATFPFPSISKKFLGKFFHQQSKGPIEVTKGSDTSTKDSESSGSGGLA
ncbi:hypothetical protein Mapa_000934 [Marchantia paleacea]|nr:hypothetical protein Mapa_000934 [Marchantia paleacea]